MGKRVLITNADVFMCPALCEVLALHGATVIASTNSLLSPDAPASVVAAAGHIDVLVVNLAVPAPTTAVTDVVDEEWSDTFAAPVNPLPRLFRAVLPAMIERRAGKILVMGSASALRGMKRASSYSAARGAQLAYVQAIGIEVASHNVLKSMPLRRTSLTTRPTSPQRFRPTRDFRSGCSEKSLLADWWAQRKTRSLPPTSTVNLPIVLLGRSSRCVAVGFSDAGLAPPGIPATRRRLVLGMKFDNENKALLN